MTSTYVRVMRVGRGTRLHIAAPGSFSRTLCGKLGIPFGRARLDGRTNCKSCLAQHHVPTKGQGGRDG